MRGGLIRKQVDLSTFLKIKSYNKKEELKENAS